MGYALVWVVVVGFLLLVFFFFNAQISSLLCLIISSHFFPFFHSPSEIQECHASGLYQYIFATYRAFVCRIWHATCCNSGKENSELMGNALQFWQRLPYYLLT